jgi:hypothetical protein
VKLRINLEGKQHGYNDNYKAGLDERFEIVRRPYSDYRNNYGSRLPHRDYNDDHDRYQPNSHWVSEFEGSLK